MDALDLAHEPAFRGGLVKRQLSPRSRRKAFALLGVDFSQIKASDRLGVTAEDLTRAQSRLAAAQLSVERKQRERGEIRRAPTKAAVFFGARSK